MEALCIVCGESHSWYTGPSMEKWEFALFKRGAGCPDCQGVPPDPEYVPISMGEVEFGDQDCIERIHAIDPAARPKWEKPESKVLWECVGCGIQSVRDENKDLAYHVPPKAACRKWYISHPLRWRSDATEAPAHIFGDEEAHEHQKQPVCEYCYSECQECDTPVSAMIEHGDTYDDGWCAVPDGHERPWCISCIENQCEGCLETHENCECEPDPERKEEEE